MAAALGYSDTSDAIQKHVDIKDKLESQIAISGQNRKIICINESGLYTLVLDNKKNGGQNLQKFETKW